MIKPLKKRNEEENLIQKIAYSKKKNAFRFYILFTLISIILIFQIINDTNSNSIKSKVNIPTNRITTNSTLKEYTFMELGLFIEPLIWDNLGFYHISINKTFDLDNTGPGMIVFDFISEGDKPDNPGYEISGLFNQILFTTTISRSVLTSEDSIIIKQIAVPLKAEGRIYGNNLFLNISCKNGDSSHNSGKITILESSKLYVGDLLLIDSFGLFSGAIYPNKLLGMASLGGITLESYVQLTIENETLLQKTDYYIQLKIVIEGDISLSIILYDEKNNVYVFDKNETSENNLIASSNFQVKKGVNYCKIEFSVYSGSLWSTSFNISIIDCQISLNEAQGGFGFGFSDLEIPFFQWPSIPLVGVIVLLLWIMPYSILKYREWKKTPDEIEVNILDDEEFNILDPEGLTADDDDDDFNDTYDVLEDD